MKFSIQEYFGAESLTLNYVNTLATPKEKTLELISEIVEVYGYSLMGVEDGVIILRLMVIPLHYNIYKKELSDMMGKLTNQFA